MKVGVQRKQTLLVTTELVLWRYDKVFFFTNQSEVDFGIALVLKRYKLCICKGALFIKHYLYSHKITEDRTTNFVYFKD
jgi:hypothetical protein